MIERFYLNNFPGLESLHDSSTSSVELKDNKLIMYFGHVCAETEAEEVTKKHRNLKATYVLNKDFQDEEWCPSVKNINHNKKFVKNAIKYLTLSKFVDALNNNKCNLRLYEHYYNRNKCMLITELIKEDVLQMGNEFYLELLIDCIIYEWN